MGVPVELGHACGLCGEQIILSIRTDGGTYTHDLAALLRASRDDTLLIEAECDCQTPRLLHLRGQTSTQAHSSVMGDVITTTVPSLKSSIASISVS
jgi:hypothetical protein